MKKFLIFFCVLNLLVLVGLIGYLLGTGRLDKPKMQAIADILRHKGTPEKFREQVQNVE